MTRLRVRASLLTGASVCASASAFPIVHQHGVGVGALLEGFHELPDLRDLQKQLAAMQAELHVLHHALEASLHGVRPGLALV
eukprot:CAMPEP_0206548666 /NCGR_PEP_ID=MMETSP0325_2-20121206/14012_1 /ASSEMBLY_ACC=CAM_ASM_000347 /TAXON_ID=2866 /ORGANISM="Crypthecodinium cohnii, Strain Seligo" /LENGTH=81 /DNA_ID=CAMNT_0054048175 /DNA_START=268 /DNA_END=513 /DNA_ORIENTATION=+